MEHSLPFDIFLNHVVKKIEIHQRNFLIEIAIGKSTFWNLIEFCTNMIPYLTTDYGVCK